MRSSLRQYLYLLQLCGYRNAEFKKIARKQTAGAVKRTARVKRIYTTAVIMCILGVGLPLLCPARTVAFANRLLLPLEKCIQKKWLRRAKRKLNRPEYKNLIKIGITGSYGKTSCKNILAAILATRFNVAASRESYNTPMGFARTVNGDLTPNVQVLIMEMGARCRGDIAEMCRLVRPDYGIITAIGPQHLETFGSIENVRAAKMEMCDFVPPDNMVVGGRGGQGGEGTPYKATAACRTAEPDRNPLGTDADGQKCSENDGACAPDTPAYETKLLGRHNRQNIHLCVQMAKKLGITDENIAAAVAGLTPTPHRLELIEAPNGIRILDDSYNSNTEGAKAALEVLASFPGGKTVQTPGIAEAGAAAEELNRELGRGIAAVADNVIITGELNKTALAAGLADAGFPAERAYFAANTEKAKTLYPHILTAGDTLLIENDLPENY